MLGPTMISSLGLQVDEAAVQQGVRVTAPALDDLEVVNAIGDGQFTAVDRTCAGSIIGQTRAVETDDRVSAGFGQAHLTSE